MQKQTTIKKADLPNLREAYLKVLYWFFSYPETSVGLSDLSEQLVIAKKTAKIIVNQFVQEGFLKVEVLGKLWRISCNRTHAYNFTKKIPYNLDMIYSSAILLEIHKHFPNPKAVILFGSYRKGDDTEKSDIDIAVEIPGKEEIKMIELGVINQFGYRTTVKINLFIFSDRKKIDVNVFSNIANGIVLEGFLEVHP
ncbi:nucleotidyltransferase domain-containing protein [Candidatus Woesearchaeota archaeon]|nr:nucleotidyltransferase domain-containing protein [Candidatus Woesearchaeota archaeon]